MVDPSSDDRDDGVRKDTQNPSTRPHQTRPAKGQSRAKTPQHGLKTARQLDENRSLSESHSVRETRVRGTSPHASVLQTQTCLVSESVASLLNRLGTPPPDLVDHLVERFERICLDREATGNSIREINLVQWHVTSDGDLLFRGAEETGESDISQSDFSDVEASAAADLARAFREHLVQPRPGGVRSRDASSDETVTRSRVEFDDRYDSDQGYAAGGEQVELTAVEQQRRDQMVSMFTDALTDRFGAEAIAPPEETEDESRPQKIQPLQTDRRFNWNMVLGIGSAVVVLCMVYAGHHITSKRQQWLAERNPVQPVIPSEIDVPENTLRERVETSSKTPVKRPNTDLSDISPLTPSAGSAFSKNRTTGKLSGPLETIESLDDSGDPLPAEVEFDEFGMRINVKKMVKVETTPVESDGNASKTSESMIDESLDQALTEMPETEDIPESPQVIRRGQQRFAQLPATNRSDRFGTIPINISEIQSLEFPVETEIELSSSPNRTFVHPPSQTVLAKLNEVDGETRFTWTAEAKKESSSTRLNHGRLVDSDGQKVYLRPSIAADAFRLSLSARQARPTWNLGPAILPTATRLDLDLNLPSLMEHQWIERFDPTTPRRGRAVAILMPPDGDSVAIALQVNVRCSRKLECYLKYAVRFDPTMPWQPITKEGLQMFNQAVRNQSSILKSQRATYDRMYADADSVQRKLLRRQRDDLNRQETELGETKERMDLLQSLVESIENSVTLDMHLYVQWPDQKQTIFRTARPVPATP